MNGCTCRTSESSFMALAINTLHSLFSNKLFFVNNFHLQLAIADSADKHLNISRHASTISWELVSKIFPQCAISNKTQEFEL